MLSKYLKKKNEDKRTILLSQASKVKQSQSMQKHVKWGSIPEISGKSCVDAFPSRAQIYTLHRKNGYEWMEPKLHKFHSQLVKKK